MDYKDYFSEWLHNNELDESERKRLSSLTEEEKKEMFYKPLEFGTAGMRGIIDLGTNRINRFTVKRATKGLADFINSLGAEAAARGVVISYDTRKFSSEFAVSSAKVLSNYGVKVWLFENVRPVPFCSFAIRHLNAECGIMITASHNPKIYNGYKVYGPDGAQMSPESTDKLVEFISSTPYFGINEGCAVLDSDSINGFNNQKIDENIMVIGKDVDDAYFEAIEKLSLSKEQVEKFGSKVKIVYTPIHGSGYMPVTTIFSRMGINVAVVPEQALPDTDFSTVRVPNPEEADTLQMGVELADKIGSDVVIGTDPDADRMGIAVRGENNKFVLLNGNQIGVLLADYIMKREAEKGTLPKNGAIVKTIVTTELARKIADNYGVATFDVLTGFKYIGEKIADWETSGEYTYVFGFEESYGSLVGTHSRDKDAVVAAMTFAEMICYYESKGQSIHEVLEEIYKKYGYFVEKSISLTFGGIDGMDNMAAIMQKIKHTRFDEILGRKVLAADDLSLGVRHLAGGVDKTLNLPKTNAVKLNLERGDWLCVRPSGTEPKLKIYAASSDAEKSAAEERANAYLEFIKSFT